MSMARRSARAVFLRGSRVVRGTRLPAIWNLQCQIPPRGIIVTGPHL
jgi:hypothetical protein